MGVGNRLRFLSLCVSYLPRDIDLIGNVFEWTSSKATSTGTELVCHGGGWKDGAAQGLPVARPGGFKQIYKCGFSGMRCFVDAPPKP